ncbi:triose-phosphate isomerase [Dethiobacter alkaliphilus]|uniref:triose-phosphate isomerase n=1 Tax=Dethiobacter alkaliphilus TaxID=427926 RepID=UPI0022267EB0|nr:triose-phosphate isomerase [Dethiobacter alkaliphilus]MCW3490006.1 triose-phosphate isomerase [Dethiobacter alkaliphilus]
MQRIFIANWKMNMSVAEMETYFQEFSKNSDFDNAEVVVCPPMPLLSLAAQHCAELGIALGAQNVFWEEAGAFTGEVSPLLLKDLGVQYVLIGHSERRQYFGETDQYVGRKVKAAIKAGLRPVVCVGESLIELRTNRTEDVIEEQISAVMRGLDPIEARRVIIAYEPVWAIGSGMTPTGEQVKEVALQIRKLMGDLFSLKIARDIKILYGGSVSPDNVDEFTASYVLHGALVGNASLDANKFSSLIQNGGGIRTASNQQEDTTPLHEGDFA